MRRCLLALVLAASSACAQERPDTRLPAWHMREDARVALIPDSAGEPLDLQVGLNGAMFVLMPGMKQIQIFSPSGVLTNILAPQPEPWVRPIKLGNVGGNLTVYDSATRKLHMLRANGEIVGTLQFQARAPGAAATRTFYQILRDSSVLLRELSDDGKSARLLRAGNAGVQEVTPLRANTRFMFSPNDAMIVLVNDAPPTADSAGFAVTKINLVGDTVFNVVWRSAKRGDATGGFSAAFLDTDGSIAVRRPEGRGKTVDWIYFSMLGQPQKRVIGPPNVRFLASQGGYAYGVRERDGLRELMRWSILQGEPQ